MLLPEKVRRRLVREARQWWKLWSVQLTALAFTLTQIDDLLPGWREVVSPEVHDWTVRAIFFAAIITRFIKQKRIDDGEDDATRQGMENSDGNT